MSEGRILIDQFNMGGIADSKHSGIPGSVAKMVGFDIHSEPGILKTNPKLQAYVNLELCRYAVDCSNGIKYWFSVESGKIWQDKNGVITLVYTTSPAAGSAICLGAAEYQGYLYWATQNRLHRIAVANADGGSQWATNGQPNWATFLSGDSSFHPMREVNLVLYVGDGRYVAQVDAGVFSNNALDIRSPLRISALGQMGTDLLIGTYISSSIAKCEVIRWNTWSVSFSSSDPVDEVGINAFLEADNYAIVNAGNSGSLYTYNGDQLQYMRKIPGEYSPTATCIVHPQSVAMYKGFMPIFGVSNLSGNPCLQGIYSLARYSPSYPMVLNLEFPVSSTDVDGYNLVSDITIGAIIVSGLDIYVSWKNASTSVIDKINYSAKIQKPYLETRAIAPDRMGIKTFTEPQVAYRSLPTGTSILMKYKKNYETSWQTLAMNNDVDRMRVYSDNLSLDANVVELRMELSNNANAPEIEALAIDIR